MTTSNAISTDDEALAFHRDQQLSRQWRSLLVALGTELPIQLGAGPAGVLLQGVGRRLAQGLPLPACQSLADAERAINEVLRAMGWGWVQLAEADHLIEIAVNEPPMGSAAECAWLGSVLEGALTTWMQSLGAGTHLTARMTAPPQPGLIRLSFGPPPATT